MDTLIAAFQRAFAYSTLGGVALLLMVLLLVFTAVLWMRTTLRSWRRGQRLQAVDQGAMSLVMAIVLAQPPLSQLGLYSPGVSLVFRALLGLAAAVTIIALWRHWHQRSRREGHISLVRWPLLTLAFLAVGAAQALIPGALPHPL